MTNNGMTNGRIPAYEGMEMLNSKYKNAVFFKGIYVSMHTCMHVYTNIYTKFVPDTCMSL